MSEQESQPQRKYHGPAELISAWTSENDLRNKNRVVESQAEQLTRQLGAEGIGWGFETDHYEEANTESDTRAEINAALAKEAHDRDMLAYKYGDSTKNGEVADHYNLDGGLNVSGRVTRIVKEPRRGNVVKYPDGAAFKAAEDERKMNKPGGGEL